MGVSDDVLHPFSVFECKLSSVLDAVNIRFSMTIARTFWRLDLRDAYLLLLILMVKWIKAEGR